MNPVMDLDPVADLSLPVNVPEKILECVELDPARPACRLDSWPES